MLIGPVAIIPRAEYRRLKDTERYAAFLEDVHRDKDGNVVLTFPLTNEREMARLYEDLKKPPPDLSKLTIGNRPR